MHRVHLKISGRVQGVGFRYFALLRARDMGVAGRVSNCPDGSVEVEAEGSRALLEQLIEMLELGPRSARVDCLERQWSEGPSRFDRFEIA